MAWSPVTTPPLRPAVTVTVTFAVPVQPAALVAVTVYVVVVEGLAVTVAPDVAERPVEGDQAYVEAPDAVRETFPPEVIEGDAGVITTVGLALTVAEPVAKYWVAAPLDVKVTFPLAPLVAVALRRT